MNLKIVFSSFAPSEKNSRFTCWCSFRTLSNYTHTGTATRQVFNSLKGCIIHLRRRITPPRLYYIKHHPAAAAMFAHSPQDINAPGSVIYLCVCWQFLLCATRLTYLYTLALSWCVWKWFHIYPGARLCGYNECANKIPSKYGRKCIYERQHVL